ncbi:putative phage-associated protein [Paenibacillus larvae subsp. larvae DSM 25430]|nr:putative phage-associated protein [Paenibacillus larvae subsp. larvae DSM 25430]
MSNYVKGMRIGWHYASEGKLDKALIKQFMSRVEEKYSDAQLGIHKIATDSVTWRSVVEKDSFFEDVFVTTDIEKFVRLIAEDQELKAYDVAKFIVSTVQVSHLKLQKLLYYVYADFLLATGKKLFKEPIVAFEYGPVVEEVFHKYKVHGSSEIDYKEDEYFCIYTDEFAVTPSFMRVASSEHGIYAVGFILKVLDKYESYSAGELVKKTHQVGGPWKRVYVKGMNYEITDELIKRYHKFVQ